MLVRVLALLGLASATNQITCPSSEWVRGPSGDRCFLHTERTRTFEECQKSVCGPAGGTLACVREEEAEWLTEQFFSDGDEDAYAWIGYSDAKNEGDFVWLNGCSSTYEGWGGDEPNDWCGDEDCTVAGVDWWGEEGQWFDMSCIEEAACLCEYPAELSDEWTAALDGIRDDTNYEDDCDDWWDDDYGEQHVDVDVEVGVNGDVRGQDGGQNVGLVVALLIAIVVILILSVALVVLICVKTEMMGSTLPSARTTAPGPMIQMRGGPTVGAVTGYAPPPEN